MWVFTRAKGPRTEDVYSTMIAAAGFSMKDGTKKVFIDTHYDSVSRTLIFASNDDAVNFYKAAQVAIEVGNLYIDANNYNIVSTE
jgi:hypothetical protein